MRKQLKLPAHIAETRKRADIVLWSDTTRQVILVELSVPWEERVSETFERKRSKYQPLLEECQYKDPGVSQWRLAAVVLRQSHYGEPLQQWGLRAK